jgi:hypothetical protein
MKNNVECPYCDGTAVFKTATREIIFKTIPIKVESHFYQFELCREEFTTTETDTLTMNQMNKTYRELSR